MGYLMTDTWFEGSVRLKVDYLMLLLWLLMLEGSWIKVVGRVDVSRLDIDILLMIGCNGRSWPYIVVRNIRIVVW